MLALMTKGKTPRVLMPSTFNQAHTLPNASGNSAIAALQLGGGGCIYFNSAITAAPQFPAIDAWPIPAPANSINLYQGRWATNVQFDVSGTQRDLRPWFEWKGRIVFGPLSYGTGVCDNTWRQFQDPSGSYGDQIGVARSPGAGPGTSSAVVEFQIRSKGAAIVLSTFEAYFDAIRTP